MKQFSQIWFENIEIKKMSECFYLGETLKNYQALYVIKKSLFFFLRMYKMYLISAEGYKNTSVEFLTIKTTSEIWVRMKNVGSDIGVKNI